MTTAMTHVAPVCCACGARTELLQWVEKHRFCLDCSAAISGEVWERFARGGTLRQGAEGPVHSALLDLLDEGEWVCKQRAPEVASCAVPMMRLMLITGFHPHDRPREWTLIASNGELTVDPLGAWLFPFTAQGSERAFIAARRWTDVLGRDCHVIPFVARVLVMGNPDAPDEVAPALTFEDDDPSSASRRYPFDPLS